MSDKYLGEVSTPLLINQIKEKCTLKVSTLPTASADELGKIYQYIGTTSGSIVHNYFYECVSDGAVIPIYSWQQVNVQPSSGTAATTSFNNATSELQATNVQDAIDEVEGRVDTTESDIDNIEGKIPSTATSTNKLIDHDSLGTAAFKDSTDRVSPNNTALVESQSVYSAINTALSSIYTPRGDITCAELTNSLLIEANVGNIYETSDSGTTSALFLQGAGHPIAVGSNVGVINAGQGRILFNLMANAFDLTDYQKKDLASTIEGATTVEGALGALSTDKQAKDLTTAVESATTVEGALGALSDNKQAKTLTTSVESQTTVEGALGALSTNKATQAEVNDIVNVLGAKNLLPNKAVSQTLNGITWTIGTDGSITANGTATANSEIDLVTDLSLSGNFIFSDGIAGISGQYWMFAMVDDSSDLKILTSTEMPITVTSKINYVRVKVFSGATVNNIKFYPMLRLASDPDNTYEPYTMTNQQITPYVQAISNPNLLDNPWFTVNQRGESSYTTNNTTIKTVDRWYINAPTERTMNVVDDGIKFPNGMESFFETIEPELVKKLKGKVVTLSVKFSGTPMSGEFFGIIADGHSWYVPSQCHFNSAINGIASITFEMPNFTNTNRYHVWMYIQSAITIHAVKLELGSVSTLAMDTIPNYATELLKCQRYFVNVFLNKSSYAGPYFAIGDAGALYMNLPLAVPLRAIPTATLDSADIHILGEGASAIVTTCAVKAIYPNNVVVKIKIGDFVSTEFVPSTNGIYSLNFFDSNSCKFWLSADL